MARKPSESELYAALERQVDAGDFKDKTASDPPLSADADFLFESFRTEIGEHFVRAMKDAGMNENQLAKKLGVTRQAVNEIILLRGNLTLKTLARYCAALGIEPILMFVHPRKGK